MMLELTVWQELAIIAGVAVMFAIIIGCMAWFLGPDGFLKEFIIERTKEKRRRARDRRRSHPTLDKIRPQFFIPTLPSKKDDEEKHLLTNTTLFQNGKGKTGQTILLHEIINGVSEVIKDNGGNKRGELHFSVRYDALASSMSVTILRGDDLTSGSFHDEPYSSISIKLVRTRKSTFSRAKKEDSVSNLTGIMQTSHVRGHKAEFDEHFLIAIKSQDMAKHGLRFHCNDYNKHTKDVVTGHLLFPLDRLIKGKLTTEQIFCEQFQPNKIQGELVLSATSLPTSEKISITVLEVKDLKLGLITEGIFVKILMLHNGHLLKKQRTSTYASSENHVAFSDTYNFNLPLTIQDNVLFIFVIMKVIADTDHKTRYDEIGRTYIGRPAGGAPTQHWLQMIRNPRKQNTWCLDLE